MVPYLALVGRTALRRVPPSKRTRQRAPRNPCIIPQCLHARRGGRPDLTAFLLRLPIYTALRAQQRLSLHNDALLPFPIPLSPTCPPIPSDPHANPQSTRRPSRSSTSAARDPSRGRRWAICYGAYAIVRPSLANILARRYTRAHPIPAASATTTTTFLPPTH